MYSSSGVSVQKLAAMTMGFVALMTLSGGHAKSMDHGKADAQALELAKQAIALRSRALLARAKARLGDAAAAQALLAVNRRFNPRNPETLSAAEEIARAEVPAGPGRRGAGAEAKTR